MRSRGCFRRRYLLELSNSGIVRFGPWTSVLQPNLMRLSGSRTPGRCSPRYLGALGGVPWMPLSRVPFLTVTLAVGLLSRGLLRTDPTWSCLRTRIVLSMSWSRLRPLASARLSTLIRTVNNCVPICPPSRDTPVYCPFRMMSCSKAPL